MKRVPFAEIDGRPYADWWCERFEPAVDPFERMRFYRRGKANIWVGTAQIEGLAATRMDAVGVHLLRVRRRMWKPTSAAIVTFGSAACANALDVRRPEARAFLARRDVVLPDDDPRGSALTHGFVAVRLSGVAIGCGEWHGRGVVTSLIPKSQAIDDIEL